MNKGTNNMDEAMKRAREAISGGTSGNAKIDGMIASLRPEDLEKLKNAMSDRKTVEKIIATEQAQQLLRTLMQKNGDANG